MWLRLSRFQRLLNVSRHAPPGLNNGTQPVQIADQVLPCNSVLQFLSFLDSPHFLGLCYLLALTYGFFFPFMVFPAEYTRMPTREIKVEILTER